MATILPDPAVPPQFHCEACGRPLPRFTSKPETDKPGFMPSEGMLTRPHDAPWDRLVRGQRVTITAGEWSSAEMRVTDVITHYDGGETYVLRDITVTEAELAAEKAAFTDLMASTVFCGTCMPGREDVRP